MVDSNVIHFAVAQMKRVESERTNILVFYEQASETRIYLVHFVGATCSLSKSYIQSMHA